MPYKINPFTRKLDFYMPSATVGSGEANVGVNLGEGAQVYAGKSGVSLQFKTLFAGSDKLSIASTGTTITYDVDPSNISHGDLDSVGTNTHEQIDTHIGDATKHRVISDAATGDDVLWSSSKISSELDAKAGLDHLHFFNPRVVFKEQFTGTGSQTVFNLDGTLLNATFSVGSWSADNILITYPFHVTGDDNRAIYDSSNVFTRNRISVSSISAAGVVTLDHAPMLDDVFYVWYWYDVQDFDSIENYYREDFVAEMESTGAEFLDPMTTRGDIIYKDASNYSNRLPVGTDGQVLQSDGTDIGWQTLAAADISDFDTEVSSNTDVADNTAHRTSDGTDHSYIDQDVTSTSSPTFATPEVASIQLDLDAGATGGEGIIKWNADEGTADIGMPGGNVNLQVGQEGLMQVRNVTGVPILNGKAVYVTGSAANRLTVDLADNTDADKILVLGLTTEDIGHNSNGYVALWGTVRGSVTQPINTNSYAPGTKLYLSTAGTWTDTHPTNPAHAVIILGIVRKQDTSEGEITIRTNYYTNGNNYDGTIRQTVLNKSTGTSAGTGFSAVNDAGYWMTVGIGGTNNSTFSNNAIFYGPGYNDNLYAVDGNKSHKWYNDPTDSHNNSSLNYLNMELSPAGNLTLARGQFTSTLSTGTSPLNVTSTTLNTNLNADLLDGQHGSYYLNGSSSIGDLADIDITGATQDQVLAYIASSGIWTPATISGGATEIDDLSDVDTSGVTQGQVLAYNISSAQWLPTTIAGSGDVVKVGTPANDQIAIWTGDGTIEGDADLTFDGSNLSVGGNIVVGGTVDGVDIATDVSANTSARHDAVTLHSSATTGGLSLSTQEISFQAATSEQSGYLTSTDWSTFNDKSDYSDPLTTRGDLLYRNSSNDTARLAVGTSAQVLQSDGTDVSWSSLVAGDLDISSLGVYGFENQTDTSIGFNDSTYVFTLTDGGSGWSYWRNGKRITISGNKTVTLSGTPPAAGIYFIYIDDESGTLTASTSGWTLVDTKVPVAILEWNNSNTPKYFLANERHQSTMPRRVHFYEHFSEGTQLKSGGLLAGYTVAPVSPVDTDNTFSISQVELLDEDLLTTSTLLADPNGTDLDYIAYFRTGASTWSWEQSAVPFRYTAAGYIQYDNAGTMTQGAANKYFNWYLCFTNYQNQPRFICVPGQSQFDSSSEAYDEAVSDLDLSGFDIQELIFAYKLTFYTSNSYSSKGKCRLVRAPAFLGIASVSTSISAGATDHNTLGGLQGGTTNEYYHLTATTHGYIDQDVTTTGTPSFTSVTVGNTGLSVGSSTPFSDSSGTLTLQNIDALDATTEATIESAIDTLANLTSVQGHTVTLTGDLVRSGAHSLTFVTTDTTSLTLPTSGTLATTAQISTMVTSSSTITDHAIVRGDGGSRGAQTSTITIDDSDRVQSVKNLGFTSTYDNENSTASFTLTLSNGQLQKVTLNADSVAMTIVDTGNIGDGQWRITVKQDETGGRAITSASVSGGTVRTEGGTAPTFSSGGSAEDTMIIVKEGSTYSIQVSATDWQTWT